MHIASHMIVGRLVHDILAAGCSIKIVEPYGVKPVCPLTNSAQRVAANIEKYDEEHLHVFLPGNTSRRIERSDGYIRLIYANGCGVINEHSPAVRHLARSADMLAGALERLEDNSRRQPMLARLMIENPLDWGQS
ncbi:hypothetical protein [Ferrovibrio terrae]|uniref:hypothetical protein n=1 Tax=Ferrovibrio terrae TaxID=2594003 RepID=UPI003138469A